MPGLVRVRAHGVPDPDGGGRASAVAAGSLFALGRLRYVQAALFTGLVQLRLAIAMWAKHVRAVGMSPVRLQAASVYAVALGTAGEHAEVTRLSQDVLDVHTRTLGPEHYNTLIAASNLAVSLSRLGEHAEAAVRLRVTLAAMTRTVGPEDDSTLATESYLVAALHRLGEFKEMEALC